MSNAPKSQRPAPRRTPTIEEAFDYDAILALVKWNVPDHEHTRHQLRHCLADLVETAIREVTEV